MERRRSSKSEAAEFPTAGYMAIMAGILTITAFVLIAYYPATKAGFIWDDDVYVTNNHLLTAPDGLRRIWFSLDSPSQYFPLVYTTFRIERAIWGLNPTGYHVVNILFHLANALLLWLFLARLSVKGAWLAAALFAVHPVHVESVAWIAERKNVLSLFFSILTMLAWLRYIETESKSSRYWWILSFLLYALALFAKTTAATLPAAMVMVIWLKGKLINRRSVLAIAPFVFWGILMGIVTVLWERYRQGAIGPEFAMSPLERVLIASRALWFYVGKLFWPSKLTITYPKWEVDQTDPVWYVWLVGLILVSAAMYKWRARIGRMATAAVLFFVVTLVPLLGFFSMCTFRYFYVADHYQYVASIGLITLAAAMITAFVRKFGRAAVLLPAVILVVFASLTWRQCLVYKDLETLWRDTLKKNPRSAVAYNNLGRVLLDRGDLDTAVKYFRAAIRIDPNRAECQNNLGLAFIMRGDVRQAKVWCQRAVNSNPNHAVFRVNLAGVYLMEGNLDKAEHEARVAIRIDPYLADAYSNLGVALARKGRLKEAINHFRRAVQLNPQDPKSQQNLERALLALRTQDKE